MKSLEVLAQLHHDLGLGELVLDHNGRSSIKIESDIIVTFELDVVLDQIELISIVLKEPFNDKAALFSRLLHDNFRSNLAGARLALDSAQEQVLLCQTLTSEHISHSHFELAVARFVTLYEEFRDSLCADSDIAVSNQGTENTAPLANAFADMPIGMVQA
ncbi:type III secretion system chaperone [Thalassomonas actiniarum]|uniref:Type III secretion system chaperone n=1 Tax=Thalassomonas actiniarum TaxID=485447 RepID=A0AAE9YXZ5_9GAMM|nr:type III secretion system chaperone [Thalassomonas actiniarum]WDE02419.1 type III secretion system chaperone [Thalassomonas actiniarum]